MKYREESQLPDKWAQTQQRRSQSEWPEQLLLHLGMQAVLLPSLSCERQKGPNLWGVQGCRQQMYQTRPNGPLVLVRGAQQPCGAVRPSTMYKKTSQETS